MKNRVVDNAGKGKALDRMIVVSGNSAEGERGCKTELTEFLSQLNVGVMGRRE